MPRSCAEKPQRTQRTQLLGKSSKRISPMDMAVKAVREPPELETGFEKGFINEYIGYGVFAQREFTKGDFLLVYRGDLIDQTEAQKREQQYKNKKELGCFMYEFVHRGKTLCIDATYSSGMGRYVNDDHKRPNAIMKKIITGANISDVSLGVFALRDISVGDELRYDYGPDVDGGMPWRVKAVVKFEDDRCLYRPHIAMYDYDMHINLDDNGSEIFSWPRQIFAKARGKKLTMQEHLRSDSHKMFTQKSSKWTELDATIATLPQLSDFVDLKSNSKRCRAVVGQNTPQFVNDMVQGPGHSVSVVPCPKIVQSEPLISLATSCASEVPVLANRPPEVFEPFNTLDTSSVLSANEMSAPILTQLDPDTVGCHVLEEAMVKDKPLMLLYASDVESFLNSCSVVIDASTATGFLPFVAVDIQADSKVDAQLKSVANRDSSIAPCRLVDYSDSLSSSDESCKEVPNVAATKRVLSVPSPDEVNEFLSCSSEIEYTVQRLNVSRIPTWDMLSSSSHSESSAQARQFPLKDVSNNRNDDCIIDQDYVSDSSGHETNGLFAWHGPLVVTGKSTETANSVSHADNIAAESDVICDLGVGGDVVNSHAVAGRKGVDTECGLTLMPKKSIKSGCKQVYDKTNYCLYCCKAICSKISRHLLHVHKNEERVLEVLQRPKGSSQRRLLLEKLANEGNFQHNVAVIQQGKGKIVVGRRTKLEHRKTSDYTVCEFCKKWQAKRNMWRHTKKCHFRTQYYTRHSDDCKTDSENGQQKRILSVKRGQALIASAVFSDKEVLSELARRMRDDDVKELVLSDELICQEAGLRMAALGDKVDQKQDDVYRVSQSVRLLGRIVRLARQSKPGINLDGLIQPCNFDLVVQAAKQMSVDKECPALNVGRSIGNLLRRVSQTKIGIALRTGSYQAEQDAVNFRKMIEAEWNSRVTRAAIRRMDKQKRQKAPVIPLTEDLQNFRSYVLKNINMLSKQLKLKHNPQDWIQLAKFTMSRLILFNKRRRAEVRELRVDEYLSRPTWENETRDELALALSPSDRMLAHRMDMVIQAGKSRKNVEAFVLLPPDARRAVDLLIEMRSLVGVPPSNPFIFARLSADSPMSGHTELQELVQQCHGLKFPERITSRKLRTYIATVSQILDMNESQLGDLSRHLGHDPKTHREFYRLSHSTVQLSTVARVLLAVDAGRLHEFKGKNITSIDVNDLPDVESGDEDDTVTGMPVSNSMVDDIPVNSNSVSDTPAHYAQPSQYMPRPVLCDEASKAPLVPSYLLPDISCGDCEVSAPVFSGERSSDDMSVPPVSFSAVLDEQLVTGEDAAALEPKSSAASKKRHGGSDKTRENSSAVKHHKRRWTESEHEGFIRAFGQAISNNTYPPTYKILQFSRKIGSRTPAQIRAQIHNYMAKQHKF